MMRANRILGTIICLLVSAGLCHASGLSGTIKMGGVFLDEQAGDLSVIQETYDIYEKFSITQLKLNGTLSSGSYLLFNLDNINLDNRAVALDYRMPGYLKLYAKYNQHRYVFDASRNAVSDRHSTRLGLSLTPVKWMAWSASYNRQSKKGDRISYPLGAKSNLGDTYDQVLQTGRIAVSANHDRRFIEAAYDFSRLSDETLSYADRSGNVVSARAFFPCFFTDRLTHSLRAAYGTQKITEQDLKYTLKDFQYVGDVRPVREFDFKYAFYARRIDDEATKLTTDLVRHSFDGAYLNEYGRVYAGYIYETNDDENALTSYHTFQTGARVHWKHWVNAAFDFSDVSKNDVNNEEKHTLLQESESNRISASLGLAPVEGLKVGVKYRNRNRDLPDIDVKIDGDVFSSYARYSYRDYGSLFLDYTFSKDKYDDREGRFETNNNTFTSRAEVTYVKNLSLAGGVTTVDIGKDLDIEKSIVFLETRYTYDRYRMEVRYNVYNFDDFLVLNRYYTANVVWINVGYDFDLK